MEETQLPGSSPFEDQPEMLLLLDSLARRYGLAPHQVMEWSPYELGLAVCCLKATDSMVGVLTKRLNSEGMPVFPVMILQQ